MPESQLNCRCGACCGPGAVSMKAELLVLVSGEGAAGC